MTFSACASDIKIDTSTETISEDIKEEIVVDVSGEVNSAGVFSLPQNSRVFDAIKKAGGITKYADITLINQAKILKDGERVYIPKIQDEKRDKRININTATEDELIQIKGIGTSKAKDIIKYRQENGAFSSIEDLSNIKGIKKSFIDKIKDYIKI